MCIYVYTAVAIDTVKANYTAVAVASATCIAIFMCLGSALNMYIYIGLPKYV